MWQHATKVILSVVSALDLSGTKFACVTTVIVWPLFLYGVPLKAVMRFLARSDQRTKTSTPWWCCCAFICYEVWQCGLNRTPSAAEFWTWKGATCAIQTQCGSLVVADTIDVCTHTMTVLTKAESIQHLAGQKRRACTQAKRTSGKTNLATFWDSLYSFQTAHCWLVASALEFVIRDCQLFFQWRA